jgi:hypothetical protein
MEIPERGKVLLAVAFGGAHPGVALEDIGYDQQDREEREVLFAYSWGMRSSAGGSAHLSHWFVDGRA